MSMMPLAAASVRNLVGSLGEELLAVGSGRLLQSDRASNKISIAVQRGCWRDSLPSRSRSDLADSSRFGQAVGSLLAG
jgi:hypothetical protein